MGHLITLHLLIDGRVQGVWFRQFTRQQAEALGVSGYVRNLPNGRVEAVLSGDERAVKQLERVLRRGPELAQVKQITSAELPHRLFEGFEVRR